MIIIFGWRKTSSVRGVHKRMFCTNCGNNRPWELVRVISWFTLFFIPIIPYKWNYFTLCPSCGYGARLRRDEYKDLLFKIKNGMF